jgi:citrate lyase subunit beta / citryl-CoA lyase
LGAVPANAMHSPLQFTHPLIVRAKTAISAACHRFGKTPSHNVTTEIRDLDTVRLDAKQAALQFGYTRMWSIHPGQILPIIDEFAPASAEIDDAAAILLHAAKNAWGPIQFKGKLHDRASYRYYWTVLRRAKLGGRMLPPEAEDLL